MHVVRALVSYGAQHLDVLDGCPAPPPPIFFSKFPSRRHYEDRKKIGGVFTVSLVFSSECAPDN